MSALIKFIEVSGLLDVSGAGDVISSCSLRHEMFKDLQPQLPISSEYKENYIELAASEIGLLRGIMDADNGLTRPSPVSVLDSYSNHFSASRKQPFEAFINVQQLQFIEQDKESFKIVPPKDSDENLYLKNLSVTFKKFGKNYDFNFSNYEYLEDETFATSRGLLLNDEQIAVLLKSALLRMSHIYDYKIDSYLKSDKQTFTVSVTFDDEIASQQFKLPDFLKELENENFDFVKFYKPA